MSTENQILVPAEMLLKTAELLHAGDQIIDDLSTRLKAAEAKTAAPQQVKVAALDSGVVANLVDALIARGFIQDPSTRNVKIASYIANPSEALRDFARLASSSSAQPVAASGGPSGVVSTKLAGFAPLNPGERESDRRLNQIVLTGG